MLTFKKDEPDTIDLDEAIRRHILQRTWGRVHRLQVDLVDERMVVHGRTATYYAKQLALEAALEALNITDATSVELDIQVGSSPFVSSRSAAAVWASATS